MLKKVIYLFLSLSLSLLISLPATNVNADVTGNTSTTSNYAVIIEDEANLLTTTEEQELRQQMATLTEYGNVMFKTTSINSGYNSERYIRNYYYSKLGNKRGVAFYIDMNNRQVCSCATGGLEKIITGGKCDTIMDNVYKYAKRGDYYGCAKETFSQMNRLLSGGKIAESMKYSCNAILSIMLSLFASFGLYQLTTKNKKASQKDLIDECEISLNHTPIQVAKTGSHREYSPVSDSSSSGGSFGGGSSGGGGGGGFSGSSGSHGF